MSLNRPAPRKPVIIVPSRMASTRLPAKPLVDINGTPMIVHVMRRAWESGVGPVVVACDDARIAEVVIKAGGHAVLTGAHHASGSDRIWEAFNLINGSESFDAIINVQGDEPALDPQLVKKAWGLLERSDVDIATLASPLGDAARRLAPQVVKAVIECEDGASFGRALYFSRAPVPFGEGPLYHHIGLYAYRLDALQRFVATPLSALERRESLEQLRALSIGLRIEVGIVAEAQAGVDTPEDLVRMRKWMETT